MKFKNLDQITDDLLKETFQSPEIKINAEFYVPSTKKQFSAWYIQFFDGVNQCVLAIPKNLLGTHYFIISEYEIFMRDFFRSTDKQSFLIERTDCINDYKGEKLNVLEASRFMNYLVFNEVKCNTI